MTGLVPKPVDTLDKHALRFIGGVERLGKVQSAFDVDAAGEPSITDVQCVGSYNWVEAKAPTIVVPGTQRAILLAVPPVDLNNADTATGSPGIWKNPVLPLVIPRDIDLRAGQPVYVDQNGHRFPSAPLVPLFAAADALADDGVTEQVDWSSVDIVTDRNGLRKLLRWATASEKLRDFRIDVQLAGTMTIILNRWEPRSVDHPHPAVYGYSFEHNTTRTPPGCEGSTGHHRIIRYVCLVHVTVESLLTGALGLRRLADGG
jgi:hypothetical protein